MANYKAELPSGDLVTIDVPEGQDPATYIPHAVQMISRGGTSSGGTMSRIADTAGKVASAVGTGLANSPQDMLDFATRTAGNAVTQPENGLMSFDPSHIADVIQGAGRGYSLGMYNPESTSPEQAARQQLGELISGGHLFNKAAGMLKPLVGPALLRNPLIASLMGAISGGAQGGVEGAAQGAGSGLGVGAMGEGMAMAGKGLLRSVMSPGEQILNTEDANAAIRSANADKVQASLDELQLRKVANADANATYVEQLGQAQAEAAGTNAAAHEAFMKARDAAQLKLDQARNAIDPAQQALVDLAQKVQPNTPSKVLYDPINEAIRTGTAPDLEIPTALKSMQDIGGEIAKSSEGLPKAAGPSGAAEKIATETATGTPNTAAASVDPVRSALLARAPESVKAFFGDAIASISNEQLQHMVDQVGPIADKTGAGVGDVASMLEGKLGLGQANRLLEVFGKQSKRSGLARNFFWDLIGDVQKAAETEPMYQQLLDARASFRQEVAASQLADLAAPTSKNGRFVYNPDKLNAIFNDQNPRRADKLMRESFPPETRQTILDTLAQVFHVKEAARNAAGELRALGKEPKSTATAKVEKPNYVSENPTAPILDPELDQTFTADKGGILKHPITLAVAAAGAINAAFGVNLTYSYLAGGFVLIKELAPPAIFKLSLALSKQPAGRAFLTNLFRNEPPNIYNTDSLKAMLNFAAIEAGRVAAQTGKMGGMAAAATQPQQPQPAGAPGGM